MDHWPTLRLKEFVIDPDSGTLTKQHFWLEKRNSLKSLRGKSTCTLGTSLWEFVDDIKLVKLTMTKQTWVRKKNHTSLRKTQQFYTSDIQGSTVYQCHRWVCHCPCGGYTLFHVPWTQSFGLANTYEFPCYFMNKTLYENSDPQEWSKIVKTYNLVAPPPVIDPTRGDSFKLWTFAEPCRKKPSIQPNITLVIAFKIYQM